MSEAILHVEYLTNVLFSAKITTIKFDINVRKILLSKIKVQGASSGSSVSLTYKTDAISSIFSAGSGQFFTTEYVPSGNTGSGRSRKNFFSRTAAKCGSPKVRSETVCPEN